MKRSFPHSEGNETPANNQFASDGQRQTDQNSNQPSTEQHSLPATSAQSFSATSTQPFTAASTQSFPCYGYGNSEYYNVDTNPNSFLMPYQRMWAENMYNMSAPENTVSSTSNVPFMRNDASSSIRQSEGQPGSIEATQGEATIRSECPVVAYTKDKAEEITHEMEDTNSIRSALLTLIDWLKNKECTKSNSDEFFTLLHTAHKQVWRLMMEKSELKDDVNKKKMEVSQKMSEISVQYTEICKVVQNTKLQKVWDQFTKGQRRKLEQWYEEIAKLQNEFKQDFVEDLEDDSDNSSDSEDAADIDRADINEYKNLQEDMDTLKHQVKALQEETVTTQMEEETTTDNRKHTIAGLVSFCSNLEEKVKEFKKSRTDINENRETSIVQPQHRLIPECQTTLNRHPEQNPNSDIVKLNPKEIRLIALIGTFLNVHRDGASLDYIFSYAVNVDKKVNDLTYLESLLRRLPKVFKEKDTGVGCNIKKTWVFLG